MRGITPQCDRDGVASGLVYYVMPRRTVVAVFILLFAVACERPTAPEARRIAQRVEEAFKRGDHIVIGNMLQTLGTAGFFPGSNPSLKNGALEIMRDGAPETINGYVIEEVLVAPRGIGRPRVRRALIGWPNDLAFALHATSDAQLSHLALVSEGSARLSPRRGITVSFRNPGKSLAGLIGEVQIGDGVTDTDCGTAPYPPVINSELPDVQCQFALYEVDVRGELALRTELQNPLLRSLQQRQHLRIAPQRVPGVRFMISCPDTAPAEHLWAPHNWECRDIGQFWRDNSQFAPALNIDVAEFRPSPGKPSWYIRKFYRQSRSHEGAFRTIRWSIFTPAGQLIERDSGGPDVAIPSRRNLDDLFSLLVIERHDRRVQALVPARDLGLGRSRYELVVLDLDVGGPP